MRALDALRQIEAHDRAAIHVERVVRLAVHEQHVAEATHQRVRRRRRRRTA